MDSRPLCYKVSDWQSSDRNVVFTQMRCHEDGSVRRGHYATKEEAEATWREKKAAVASEYEKLKPLAMELLKEKESYLLEVFASLGVEVYTDASAWDDSGLNSWLCLATTLEGKEASHRYELKVH